MPVTYPKQELFRLYEQKDETLIRIIAAKIERYSDDPVSLKIENGVDDENEDRYISIHLLNGTRKDGDIFAALCWAYFSGWKKSFKDEIFTG
jgi:hypothetical protein